MITTEGQLHVKRYLMGANGSIAQSISLGVGNAAETAGDRNLNFEVLRTDVSLVSYDFINNRLIFKASVPEEFLGTIYEAGLYSLSSNDDAGDFGSRIISVVDNTTETWTGVFSSNNARIGSVALQQTPAVSATTTDTMTDVLLDLSGYSSADQFVFAFNVGNSFASAVRFRFMTDASNYYEFNLGAQTAGYKVTRATKGSAVPTGTPNWTNITQIQIATTSTAGGSATVTIDGIRIDDVDTINPDYVLVAREVLPAPFTKSDTMAQDVEFSLSVTVT